LVATFDSYLNIVKEEGLRSKSSNAAAVVEAVDGIIEATLRIIDFRF
jgi:hypothetical protein